MAEVSNRKIQWITSSFFVLLYFCSLPAQAQYDGGTGEPNDPYLIYTPEQMNEIGSNPEDWNKHFKLMADINLSIYTRTDFNIIGDVDRPFTGVFDGNRHTISQFNYTSTNRDYIGLFGYVNDPNTEIRDLGLLSPNVVAGIGCYVSAIVGCLSNGIISNCYVEGGNVSGNKYVGGLVGGNLPVCSARPEDFVDEWLNDDSETGGMTRLIVDFQNGIMNVHGYGKCHPIDCDWGIITAEYTGNPFIAVYEFGFMTTTLTIRLISPNSLHVHSCNVSYDGTNRDYEADYFMHRTAEPPVHPDGQAVKKYGNSKIAMCYSTASISGIDLVGGLMGNNYGTVSDSYSASNIFGNNDVGGLVGYNYGQITGCSTTGSVQGNKYVGGLAGNDVMGQISNSYAISSVNGNDRVGGLAGAIDFGTVTDCYATGSVSANENVGGLIGHNWNGKVFASFWDTQTSGQMRSYSGTGKTTAEMQIAGTFLEAGWDFVDETANGTEDIWWILEGLDYPRLWWQYGKAFSPYPRDGAVDVPQSPILHWAPRGYALRHDVYFGESEQEVFNATTKSLSIYRGRQEPEITSYDPGTLKLEKTYYWRIDEVYQADPDSPWKGDVWCFTTSNFIVVDDFEDYDSDQNYIWRSWYDGLGPDISLLPGNGTGSAVGDETTASYTEETIVHGGNQSMPLAYDNNKQGYAKYSETEKRSLIYPRDWTKEGVSELSLWFHGRCDSVGNFVEEPIGVFTINSSGTDIGGERDQFHFASKMLTGSGSIVARIESIENTHEWAKAGVMIRQSLHEISKHAFVYVTPSNGIAFQARTEWGQTSSATNQTGITAPLWLKLERDEAGNFTASHSANGTAWQPVQNAVPMNISMSSNVRIGLALTAHNSDATSQAVFSNVTISGTVSEQWWHQDIGIVNNDPEPMYVAVTNRIGTPVVVYHDDPNAVKIDTWTEWVIPLQTFTDQGIDLTDVDRIAIGFGTRGNMTIPGGQGKMYFDDTRLYRPRPAVSNDLEVNVP